MFHMKNLIDVFPAADDFEANIYKLLVCHNLNKLAALQRAYINNKLTALLLFLSFFLSL